MKTLNAMLQAGAPSLHYYCAVVLHSCIVQTSVGHSSNHQYHCCQLTDNRAVFWIFIALLRFSFDSPSYVFPAHPPTNFHKYYSLTIHYGASELKFQKTLANATEITLKMQCRKWGRHLYTTTAPSCCSPASYCHLSATLQTISIIVVKLQDNRAVFWFVIALLRFSLDSPTNVFPADLPAPFKKLRNLSLCLRRSTWRFGSWLSGLDWLTGIRVSEDSD